MPSELTNLFAHVAASLPEELVDTLLTQPKLRIERIVSPGHGPHGEASPAGFWYDQAEHEWVALLQGAATLRFEQGDRVVELKPGDFINIPAGERHRVEGTAPDEPTIWLAIFYA